MALEASRRSGSFPLVLLLALLAWINSPSRPPIHAAQVLPAVQFANREVTVVHRMPLFWIAATAAAVQSFEFIKGLC